MSIVNPALVRELGTKFAPALYTAAGAMLANRDVEMPTTARNTILDLANGNTGRLLQMPAPERRGFVREMANVANRLGFETVASTLRSVAGESVNDDDWDEWVRLHLQAPYVSDKGADVIRDIAPYIVPPSTSARETPHDALSLHDSDALRIHNARIVNRLAGSLGGVVRVTELREFIEMCVRKVDTDEGSIRGFDAQQAIEDVDMRKFNIDLLR